MQATRRRHHPNCFVCGEQRLDGLNVTYTPCGDGGVVATVVCGADMQGYEGLVHGGVVASLLDGAMTNCLFAAGVAGLTADLHVRYRHPVELHRPTRIVATITRQSPPLYVLTATIEQDGRICGQSTGKFMQRPQVLSEGSHDH